MVVRDELWRSLRVPALLRKVDSDLRLSRAQGTTITGLVAYLLQHVLLRLPFGIFGAALVGSFLLAQRSLYRHVADVATALETGGVEAGRAAVARVVGRDTAALDAAGVARAAIESLAENFSDAIVAPVFWMAIAGLPGAAIYKAINTADSMIGHLLSATRLSAGPRRGSTIWSICPHRGLRRCF